jgi:hypothetical protein
MSMGKKKKSKTQAAGKTITALTVKDILDVRFPPQLRRTPSTSD